MRLLLTALFAVMSFPWVARAYPDYAILHHINSCTACHESPVGGGPRNKNGKLYGAHGFKLNPFLINDLVSADFRAMYFYPQHVTQTKSGFGLMAGNVAAHIPLDPDKKFKLVIEHNLAGFSGAPNRDTYLLYQFHPPETARWVSSVLAGRFRLPFGLVTDEHRTYTKVQTRTSYIDLWGGALLSGDPSLNFHYDFALINGEATGAASLNNAQAARWGEVLNLRWMLNSVLLGGSVMHVDRGRDPSMGASAVYGLWSLQRMSDGAIPVTLRLEYDRSWKNDANLQAGFVSDPAYQTSLASATSEGIWAQANWYLSSRFWIIYKFDWLKPDRVYPADFYERHGLGFNWVIGPDVMIQTRGELARATHPSEKNGLGWAAQDSLWALLRVEL